jgi:hypothetical protein
MSTALNQTSKGADNSVFFFALAEKKWMLGLG